jgi:hypothetical protein
LVKWLYLSLGADFVAPWYDGWTCSRLRQGLDAAGFHNGNHELFCQICFWHFTDLLDVWLAPKKQM